VTETNKSRVAYIESEMAKRRLAQALPEASNLTPNARNSDDEESDPDPDSAPAPNSNPNLNPPGKPTVQRQPAALGKIHEIDLGTAASLRNQQRTELAIRRARGEAIPPEHPPVVKKPRLGRNGKPRRGPKRRNSEDVQRDQLVEQVLRESRREWTHLPPIPPALTNPKWRYTTSRPPHRQKKQQQQQQKVKKTPWMRTTESPSNSSRTSWTPCRRDDATAAVANRNHPPPSSRASRSPVVPSWAAVGAPEPPCASCS
jgi:hypothetical protein